MTVTLPPSIRGRMYQVHRNVVFRQWALVVFASEAFPWEETLIFPRLEDSVDAPLLSQSQSDIAHALVAMLPTITLKRHCLCGDYREVNDHSLCIPTRAEWVCSGNEAGLGPRARQTTERFATLRAHQIADNKLRKLGQTDWITEARG